MDSNKTSLRHDLFLEEIKREGIPPEVLEALPRFCDRANVMTLEYLTRVFTSGQRPDLHIACDSRAYPLEVVAVSILTFQQEAPTVEFLEVLPEYRGKGYATWILELLKQKYLFMQAVYPSMLREFMEKQGFIPTTQSPSIHNGQEFCFLGLYTDANAGIATLH